MAGELIFAPEAMQDLADAYAWYEEQRLGLGEDFMGSVDACIHGIRRNPMLHAVIDGNVRRALVRRFPFSVFYEFTDDAMTVFGVFHSSRDPEKWRRRLR